MSDILDIHSQCGSEFGEEIDSVTKAVKEGAKYRKGRGFVTGNTGSELNKIRIFERLTSNEIREEKYLKNQPQKSVEGWVLFVTGIHEEATEDDIKELFSDCGQMKNLSMNLDRRTGFLKGYALIEYIDYEQANSAREMFDETQFLGQTIKVSWCFTKESMLKLHNYRSDVKLNSYNFYKA